MTHPTPPHPNACSLPRLFPQVLLFVETRPVQHVLDEVQYCCHEGVQVPWTDPRSIAPPPLDEYDSYPPSPPRAQNCGTLEDTFKSCPMLTQAGECEKSPKQMAKACACSCWKRAMMRGVLFLSLDPFLPYVTHMSEPILPISHLEILL